jgi:iron complex transport system substrate-binding protein
MSARPRAALLGAAALVTAAALPLTACGGSSAGSTSGASGASASGVVSVATTYPLTIDNCGRKVTFAKAPERVLILNGTSVGEVESFITLGLGNRVVANSQSYGISDDPTMVAKVKAVPTGGLTLNKNFDVPAEQVLALKPDLVVSTWSGGFDGSMGFATRDQLTKAGINTLVNPVNCAYGATNPSGEDKAVYDAMSLRSSADFLQLLGQVFDVQPKAAQVVTESDARLATVRAKVTGRPVRKVLVAFPEMAMMNAHGLPAVMSGGIYDDVVRASGGQNTFEGKGPAFTSSVSSEQLAAAQVDCVVIGRYTPGGDPAEEAAKLFAAYPQWQASKTKTWVAASDGLYLGPENAAAVEKIAKTIHPDAF